MRRWRTLAAGLACVTWITGCSALPGPVALGDVEEPARVVYVASNGWHTGIVLARGDLLPTGRIPEAADFPDAEFLEFGWGDDVYYPAPDPTIAMALRAALKPTPAMIHMVGVFLPPQHWYPDAEVLAVPVTATGLDDLIVSIDAAFDRPPGQRAGVAAPGLYPTSAFYPAQGRFHLFNTCNTWTARKLAKAGVDVSSFGVMTAEGLMHQLRALPGVTPVADAEDLRWTGLPGNPLGAVERIGLRPSATV